MSRFLEFSDLSEAEGRQLQELFAQTRAEMGRELARFRSWPTRRTVAVIAVLAVVAAALALLPVTNAWAVAVTALVVVLAPSIVFVLVGALDVHRVCEHGLVVGIRRNSRYVIPWSSIDPARVHVVERITLLGRRPELPMASPHYRVGGLSTRGLAVNGYDSAVRGWARVPGILEVSDATVPGGRDRVTPFVWWLLGTPRPEALARAMESAMVADGYPAAGLADRAVATRFSAPWRPTPQSPIPPRRLTDPLLG